VHGHVLQLEELALIDLLTYRQQALAARRLYTTTVNRRMDALQRLCR
jgi:hypothetical protein